MINTLDPILYLLPVPLADIEPQYCLPEYNRQVLKNLKYFIVENVRSARRFIRSVDRTIDIEGLTFFELNKHTEQQKLSTYLAPMGEGNSIGIISEAGCPAIADPGSDIVAIAQRRGYRIEPLVGPSSILLALMGSGFNGQGFTFRGYLPIDTDKRLQIIRDMEHKVIKQKETQIFIETPYRNDRLLEELLRICHRDMMLCVACDLTSPTAYIRTLSIDQWRKQSAPSLHKRPCIFLLG